MNIFHGIRNARAADSKLDGTSCISKFEAGIIRDAFDGKADSHLHRKSQYFDDLATIGEKMQNANFLMFPEWSIVEYRKT